MNVDSLENVDQLEVPVFKEAREKLELKEMMEPLEHKELMEGIYLKQLHFDDLLNIIYWITARVTKDHLVWLVFLV